MPYRGLSHDSYKQLTKSAKILISDQIAFAAVVYFGQDLGFCRLINKSVLKWLLLIMCLTNRTMARSTLFSRNHLTLRP